MMRCKMLLSLTALLGILGLGMSADSHTARVAPRHAAVSTDCCAVPTCPPGCCPECPPDCCAVPAKSPARPECPPCPFCP